MDLPQPVIELDAHLTLRQFDGEADLAEFCQVIEESLEHLRPWMPWVADHSPAFTADFLTQLPGRWANGTEHTYAVVLDGAIVGACSLFRRDETPAGAREIGYWLHPAATGGGIATRAAGAMVEQAFRLPGVECVEIVTDPGNLPSAAVPTRLGFTVDRRRPAERVAPAETGEELFWRLTRDQ
ncbi:GNAT family N-acetyltransferase [Kitasatospora sp. NPDC006697]|uniref:GNAT family N-acetyltransferase n=1 Tax=Kitasatospora sp. NPDC006697 TaxID=3364020 RepID=UPI0036B5C590